MLSRLLHALESRTGWPGAARRLMDTPIAGGARLAYAFGAMILALFALEFATGAALAMLYAPSSQTAWASVFHIEHAFRYGRLVRGVHFWAAQAMVVVTVTHLLQVVLFGAYKKPREVNWWVGLVLLGLVVGFAHTGALLPWDQGAYWITRVEVGIAGTMPPAGPTMQRLIQGGRAVGSLTVTRVYGLHVGVLPVLTLLVIGLHLALHRRHGIVPPPSVPLALGPEATEADVAAARERGVRVGRMWPDQVFVQAVASFAVVALVFWLARRHGAPLDAPADPQGDFPARPEWYLLWIFKLRKYFEGKTEIIATAVLPTLGIGFLAALPLMDRGPSRALRGPRVALVAAVGLLFAGVAGLTALSVRADHADPAFRRARTLADQRAARARELAAAGIPPEGPLEMMRNDPRVRPGELFAAQCGGCHAPSDAPLRDARGERTNARGPTLAGFGSREWIRALLVNPDADALFGRTDIHDMPALAQRMGADGVAAVAEYMYAQSVERGDPPADAALVAAGEALYHNRCTRCHQGAGDLSETEAVDRDAPDLTGWGSRAYIREQIVHPAAPTNYGARNHMPDFADDLRGRELEFVVDHVRGLRAAVAPTPQPPPPRAPRPDPPADPPAP